MSAPVELAMKIGTRLDLRSIYPMMNAMIDHFSSCGSAYALIWVCCCCRRYVPSLPLQTSARVTRPARPCCPWRGVAGWQPTAGGRAGAMHCFGLCYVWAHREDAVAAAEAANPYQFIS